MNLIGKRKGKYGVILTEAELIVLYLCHMSVGVGEIQKILKTHDYKDVVCDKPADNKLFHDLNDAVLEKDEDE